MPMKPPLPHSLGQARPPPMTASSALPMIDDLQVQGLSLGGIETFVHIPQLKLAIDVGRGPRSLVSCETIALTHAHIDHAAGLPYLIAMRNFLNMRPPTILAPESCLEDLHAMIRTWDSLQRETSDYTLVGLAPGDHYTIRRDIDLVAFRTHHVTPSLGYTLKRKVDKLRPEFAGLPSTKIVELKRQGQSITTRKERAFLSVTGDTLPRVIETHPELMDSEVVIMECTFLDDTKPYEAARKGGHIHLRDLIERADVLNCSRLILSHFSQLYPFEEVPQHLRPLDSAIEAELWAWPMLAGQLPTRVSP